MVKNMHMMKLQTQFFNKIVSGEKTIEMRLLDEKRKKINRGDSIIFTDIGDSNRSIEVVVVDLLYFNNFQELYDFVPKMYLGYGALEKADPKDMEAFYSQEQQRKYGVVGIELKLKDRIL